MESRDCQNATTDILRLHKLCFKNGETIDGRLWNEGNELIRKRYNMDMDDWTMVRNKYVKPILEELKKGK